MNIQQVQAIIAEAVEKHNGGMGKICLLEHRVEGLEKDVRGLGA